MKRLIWSCALLLGLTFHGWAGARAADTIEIGSGSGRPGTQVEIPITGQTGRDYAAVTVRVTFPDELCAAIADASVTRSDGSYALVEPQQETLFCPEAGVILVSFFVLNATAIPVGQGPLAVIRMQLAAGAPPGNYPMGATVTQASGTNGGLYAAEFVVQEVGTITVAELATATATATPQPTATATRTMGPSGCAGDCDERGTVTVDELIMGVAIALGSAELEQCPSFNTDGSRTVTTDELIKGVRNALGACLPPGPTATPSRTRTPTLRPTVTPPFLSRQGARWQEPARLLFGDENPT